MRQAVAETTRTLPPRKSLRSNVIAMYGLQLSNYLLPMITLPYLIRVLGAESYGVLAIAHATVFFFVLAVDAGIDNRAARQLARVRHSHSAVERVYAATQWVKLAIGVIALALLLVLITALPAMRQHAPVYLASFATVVGSLLFPTWLFQGIERMHVITGCSVTGRVAVTVAIFLLVDGPGDVALAALLQASATALSGLFALNYICRGLQLRLFLPVHRLLVEIRRLLRDSAGLWTSEFSTNAMANSGVFVLSLFVSEATVGVFAAVEKLFRAACNLFGPLTRAMFPRATRHWAEGSSEGETFARTCIYRIILLGAFAGVAMALLARPTLAILFGESWAIHAGLLQLLAIAMFLGVASSAVGQLAVLARGHSSVYVRVMLAGAIVQLVAAFVGAAYGGAMGLSVAFILAESVRAFGYGASVLHHSPGGRS